MKRFFRTALALLLILLLTVPVWAVGPQESDVYYDQLNETAQKIYAALDAPESLGAYYSGDGIEVSFSLEGADFEQTAQWIFDAVGYAYSAFELNHPELFWLDGDHTEIAGTYYELTLTVTPQFAGNWATGGRSTYDDAQTIAAAVQSLAEDARAQGGRYEQLCYVHDWLTEHNEYNSAAAAMDTGADYLPWTPLAALTDESRPVCEGYAKTFKLVCDVLGIPCLTVDGSAGGSGHMWNQVLLYGAWYAVDVTWDDPVVKGVSGERSGRENRDYFLIGANTVNEKGEVFSETHIPDGVRIAGTRFDFPDLSETAFDPEAPHAPDETEEPEPEPIVFADVPEDVYYTPAVNWAVAIGVTNGTKLNDENGLNWFSPDETVTRGQAVTFLWRSRGCPEPETAENPFADVLETDYFYKAVLWAVENGVTNGTGKDEQGNMLFSPKQSVTRGQMITFLWRTMGKPGYTGEGYGGYADAEYWAHEVGCLGDIAASYTTGAACPRSDVVYYLFQAVLLMAG